MPEGRALEGQRFGRLTAINIHDRIELSGTMFRRWRCLCDCGKEVFAVTGALTSGNTQSCGCRKSDVIRELKTTHGLTGSPEHGVWQGMLRRCLTPTNMNYSNYGGRGITVYDRWLSFETFLADMGKRPKGMTLERKDNSGNYEPGNCEWATRSAQCKNQRQRKDNTSGVTGVVWNDARKKWEAFLGHEGRRIYLGLFETVEDAAVARNAATPQYGFNPSHGGSR